MRVNVVREAPLPFALPHAAGHRGPWLRLLSQVLQLAGPEAEFLRHDEKPWSSATFSGSRHTILLAFEGVDAVAKGEAYMSALPEHEFTFTRQIVAEAAVIAVEHVTTPTARMTVEAELLMLEDC